ncbi:GntR family transcriptional regulator [Lysinibacillus sp. 54212]|uniref:GntR family transcriptional regulator n=1 Tax=Lysinibacillus sp. 54212 TaxID=3119829 RepID=UPI002FC8833E
MKNIKRNLSEHIETIIRKRIMLLEFKEGEHIKENKLAEEFNISRGPIREAITKLEIEGLVTRALNGRTLVSKFDIQYVKNLYDVRILLEKFAIQALSNGVAVEELEELQAYVDEMNNQRDDSDAYREADINFHFLLVKLSKNKTLIQSWLALKDLLLTLIEVTTTASHERRDDIIDQHDAIIVAIRNEKYEEASAYLEEHLNSASQYYRDAVFRLQNEEE